jgi:hypothetical protein
MNEAQGHEQTKQEPQSNAHQDSMRQTILNSIKSGGLSRKPRWQFILQATFAAIGVILVLLAAVYLASAVFFALRVNGSWFLPTLGFAGVPEFLRSLPWVLLILSIIFVVLLYELVKRYAFAYGRPLLYSALAVVVVVTASAVLVGFTSLHKGIFQLARDGELPFAGTPLFENFGRQPNDVTIGIITSLSRMSMTITAHDRISYTITLSATIQPPANAKAGDEVVVLGYRHDNTIDVEAIRSLQHGYGGMDMPQDQNIPAKNPSGTTQPMPGSTNQGLMIPAQPAH